MYAYVLSNIINFQKIITYMYIYNNIDKNELTNYTSIEIHIIYIYIYMYIYVDFRKAFDSIDRGRMFKILIAYGIPTHLVNMISITCENSEAKVLTPDGETNAFHINSGVLQVDTLALFLFIIVLEYAMRSAIQGREEELGFELEPKKSRRYPATILTDISYSDDIALVSHDVCQA